jgi:LmbE family N-acetylglucosaminyl deacetylase
MDLLTKIIDKKMPCVFISPHPDDVILSCSALLAKLSGKTDITIITVFSKAHAKPFTLSTRAFLKASGSVDAQALYQERNEEDKKAFGAFKVKLVYLDLEDALFRRKKKKSLLGKIIPEFDHLYPTYRWHVIKKIAKNDTAVTDLKSKLQKFRSKKNLVFAPYGIGNHADHVITRKISEKLFSNIILYSDFPYNARLQNDGIATDGQKNYKITPDFEKKDTIIQVYKTQMKGLFPDGTIPHRDEVYFINKTVSFK